MGTTTNAPNAQRLAIDGELTIYRAAELKPVLLEALQGADDLEIDLSAVSEIDTAGVQLLMLAKKTAVARGATLRLASHSPAVVDALQLLDLAAFFGDPLVVSTDPA